VQGLKKIFVLNTWTVIFEYKGYCRTTTTTTTTTT